MEIRIKHRPGIAVCVTCLCVSRACVCVCVFGLVSTRKWELGSETGYYPPRARSKLFLLELRPDHSSIVHQRHRPDRKPWGVWIDWGAAALVQHRPITTSTTWRPTLIVYIWLSSENR